uniref:Sulfatase N-terminal domain-containing protein n=1 Tax=Arion vulgaris TaxID=1028688 RepID=A0A0B6ZQB1_9EUPU
MIGIDSVSRLNFIRQMQQTRRFLHNELKAFEMSAYNKVADNTFVNIVPMMVGKFVSEIGWNETMPKKPFDDYAFLWKNFSKAGYRTLYAEDAPGVAIFVYSKGGFHTPPSDYYNRPLAVAMEKHKAVWSTGHHCIADRLETTMVLDYITDFSRVFRDKPHFGFSFITRLTHDNTELVSSADFAYLKFFKRFKEEGHLNNTVLILYSDHGYRFGKMRASYIGKVEERLPFMYLIFPPSFHQKYPSLVSNLRTNAQRLTTPFDVYETLKDILYFDGEDRKADINKRGISLLREIPTERTCEHAGILPHWCLCLEQKKLEPTSQLANQIAQAVVSQINRQMSSVSHMCSKLKVSTILDIVEMQPNDKVLRFQNSFHDVINRMEVYGEKSVAPIVYQVTLSTFPGHGQFEATIIYDSVLDIYKPGGDISRVNAYGDQSKCVNNSKLKKFCFCIE